MRELRAKSTSCAAHRRFTAGCPGCRERARRYETVRLLERSQTGTHRYVSALGTSRRLHALAAIGWSFSEVGRRLGVSDKQVSLWARRGGEGVVHRDTLTRVAVLYQQLEVLSGPSLLSRNLARQRGWAEPLAWPEGTLDDPQASPLDLEADDVLDETAIARAVAGQPVSLTAAERDVAVPLMREEGISLARCAAILGTTDRSIQRLLARQRSLESMRQAVQQAA